MLKRRETKQRGIVLETVRNRTDHPTAYTVFRRRAVFEGICPECKTEKIYNPKEEKERVKQYMHWKKAAAQALLLAVGTVMLCAGALRGEAATVLSKAIRLCLECVGIG